MSELNPEMATIDRKIFVRGTIAALTGLHIGGNSVGMAIGGADSVVVRNSLNNQPYIPGSSLRGKMRALMERVRGQEGEDGEGGFSWNPQKMEALAGKNSGTLLGRLFGVSAAEDHATPTRLTVRDAHLTEKSLKALQEAPNTDMPLSEVKTEVWIDRITSAANPRQIERVPAGAEFSFEMVLTLVRGDDIQRYLELLQEGMALVEGDTLGGNGSRGYGQVRFQVNDVLERTSRDYREGRAASRVRELPAGLTEEAL